MGTSPPKSIHWYHCNIMCTKTHKWMMVLLNPRTYWTQRPRDRVNITILSADVHILYVCRFTRQHEDTKVVNVIIQHLISHGFGN